MKKIIGIICLLCLAGLGIGAGFWYASEVDREEKIELEQKMMSRAEKMLNQLYVDDQQTKPRLDITKKELESLKKQIQAMSSGSEKEKLEKQYQKIQTFYDLQQELNHFFENQVIKEEITKDNLLAFQEKLSKLEPTWQELLQESFQFGMQQLSQTETAISKLKSLFQDEQLMTVRSDVTRDEYQDVYQFMKNIPQTWVIGKYEEKFQLVNEAITKKEEEQKRKTAEERERQRQIALEKKRKEDEERRKIEEAYIEVTGIPFINQKVNQVYNGCEAASLLMALQYKGLATEHNLHSFATALTKHDTDPHQGFIHSIFDLEPKNVTHWIAPDALTRFGLNYGSVQDISGSGVDTLKNYIRQGKPVVVYVTSNFNYPTSWDGEVPLNLHVVLLTGYNSITGNYIVLDPWSGRKIILKQKFESIYNLMKYAVVVL